MSEKIDKTDNSGEIDLIEVIKTIWAGRKTVYKSIGVCIILGIIIVIGTPKEYKSEAKLLVETSSSSSGVSGLLQQFGGLAGINLGGNNGEDALIPELYPDIVKSTPFLLEVLDLNVKPVNSDSAIIFSKYLTFYNKGSLIGNVIKYTFGLPGIFVGWIKGKKEVKTNSPLNDSIGRPLRLTTKQDEQIKSIKGIIAVDQDEATGILTISVSTQDPEVSAELVNDLVKLLSKYIIEYRVQKAMIDLKFVKERHLEAEQRYKEAQRNLAYFKDKNMNMILASAQTKEQTLQSEYNLAFNIYNTLSQQLEQSKMKVQEKTPVFKVMEPAKIPLQKSKPQTTIILIGMVFLGVFVGTGIIFLKSVNFNK